MIKIVEPIDGAILNRNDGRLTPKGLEITVKGIVLPKYNMVWVNDNEVDVINGIFACNIVLKKEENKILAFARVNEGEASFADVITVLWDKNSIKRYRFSIDDNIIFLKDLALNADKYHSIFDNELLNFLKQIHEKYGTKIQLNIFYQNEGFNLTQMPEKYKSEWLENADWLKLAFHSLQPSEEPYKNATYKEMERDFLLVTKEIERFAGKELLGTFIAIHWGAATEEACVALRNCGVRSLTAHFAYPEPVDGGWWNYYFDNERTRYLRTHDYWKDPRTGIIFMRQDFFLNGHLELNEKVGPHLNEYVAKNPHQSEIIELVTHEYHFYNKPDHKEKIIDAIEWLTNNGYKPVHYEEGFIGSPSE